MDLKKHHFTLLILIIIIVAIKFGAQLLQEHMTTIYPIIVFLLLLTVIIFMIKAKIKISKWAWLIFLIAIVFQMFFMPHNHYFTPDDYWLMEQGKNTALEGSSQVCHYNINEERVCSIVKSTGYSSILAIPFLIFGLGNYIAMWFSVIVSSSLVLFLYLFVKTYLKNERIALLASFLLIVSNLNVYLSSHVENINVGIIFILISLTFLAFYFREKRLDYHLIAVSSLLISAFIRIEYSLFAIIFLVVYIKMKKFDNKLLLPLTLMIAIFGLLIAQIKTIASTGYNAQFSFYNLSQNILGVHFAWLQIVLLLIAIMGIVLLRKKSIWFVSVYIISVLFYFTWTQTNLYRVMMLPLVCFLILEGAGLEYISQKNKKIFWVVILIIIIYFGINHFFLVNSIEDNKYVIYNTNALNELDDFEGCYVIVERPVFATATTNIKAIHTTDFLWDDIASRGLVDSKCVLFFENNYCFEDVDGGPGRDEYAMNSTGRCKELKEKYDLTIQKEYKKFNYTIYRLK
ncbi:glycosyltransferase family 39 protein [archaeon]|nr:glycosyltransferase family 39 protein [archaeon]